VTITLDGFGVPLGHEHPQQQPACIMLTGQPLVPRIHPAMVPSETMCPAM
jgi:hypothetical protein